MTNLRAVQDEAAQQRTARKAAEHASISRPNATSSGLNPLQTALDAQSVLIQTERDDAALAADTASARVTLLMAVGGGFEPANDSKDDDHEQR